MTQKHFILTIGRRIGAGGLAVAHILSEQLGVKMYDKELLTEAAKACGLSPEVFAPSDEKPRKRGLLSLLTGGVLSPLTESMANRSYLGDDNLFALQSEVMRRIASEGSCIFVGRCADYVLRDDPGIFNVFVTAPMEERVARVAADKNIEVAAARRMVEQAERSRADYYNYFTFKRWGDSASYDLCVDSSTAGGFEQTAEIILYVMRQRGLID